jgi:hypothetical protein
MTLAEVVHSSLNHRSRSSTASTPSTMEGREVSNNNRAAGISSGGPMGPLLSDELERSSWGMATQMVHSLFGVEFGPCWGDFFCSHGRIRGRPYAVTNGILFYSNSALIKTFRRHVITTLNPNKCDIVPTFHGLKE